MKDIKDLGETFLVGAFFLIGIFFIWKLLSRKKFPLCNEFKLKEIPALHAICFLAVCYFFGIFLEITSDYAVGKQTKDLWLIQFFMQGFPQNDELKQEVLFKDDDFTKLGREVGKAHLFSKYAEDKYKKVLTHLEDAIKSNEEDTNLMTLINKKKWEQEFHDDIKKAFKSSIQETYPPPGEVKSEFIELIKCTALIIYYNGKNRVYREDNYFKELTDIQKRIDFIRAIGLVFVFLGLSIIVIFFFPKLRSKLSESFTQDEKEEKMTIKSLVIRSLVILISMSLLYYFAGRIYGYEEKQFNKRVFGYFILLESKQENKAPELMQITIQD